MRAFVTYASADRALAERVCRVLETEGHDVFFDRDDLHGGDAFGERIRSAIERSHLLVYLISKASITPPSYALTELTIALGLKARQRPAILPVRVDATPIADVPAALRAFTMLEPQGDVPAEIAAAVERIAQSGASVSWRPASPPPSRSSPLPPADGSPCRPGTGTQGSSVRPTDSATSSAPDAGAAVTPANTGTGAAGASRSSTPTSPPVDPFAPGGPLPMPTPDTIEAWNEAMLQRVPPERRVSLIGMPGADGWAATLILADQSATKLEYRLDGEKTFTDTGTNEIAISVTGHPQPNTYIQIPGEFWQRRQITVKYTDAKGRQHGPYRPRLRATIEFVRFTKQSLNAVPWLTFQSNSPSALVAYFTTLVTFRAAFREIRYSIDTDAVDKVFPLKHDASDGWPGRIDDDVTQIKLPPKAAFVTVQLTYVDGTMQTKKVIVRRGGS